jgi:hypothetical protein
MNAGRDLEGCAVVQIANLSDGHSGVCGQRSAIWPVIDGHRANGACVRCNLEPKLVLYIAILRPFHNDRLCSGPRQGT